MKSKTFDISLWEKSLEEDYHEREQQRLAMLKKTAKALKAYFKNKKVEMVFLVGSILEEGGFYSFSDIDVAADGFKEDYLKTLSELESILERNVDLIEMEKCRFKDSLIKRGFRIL